MPRDLRANENQKRARARREGALARAEFRYPSAARTAAAGPTSFPVKAEDPAIRAAIDKFLSGEDGDSR